MGQVSETENETEEVAAALQEEHGILDQDQDEEEDATDK